MMNDENNDGRKLSDRRKLLIGAATSAIPITLLAMMSGSRSACAGQIAADAPADDLTRDVRQFGAVAGVRTVEQAKKNTEAFRKALGSYEADQARLAAPVTVIVPPGDWFLYDGVTVPKGCRLIGSGMGATRLIISNEINANPRPVVTLGRVIAKNGEFTGHRGRGTGEGQLPDPAPSVEDLLISTYKDGISTETAGWLVRNIWLFAGRGIVARNDGLIQNIVVDSNSQNGLVFENCQNTIASSIYIFGANYGLSFGNNNNNIRLSDVNITYSKYSPIVFNDKTANSNINISDLSIIQNDSYQKTFLNCIHIRSSYLTLTVNNGLFSNYKGYAIANGLMGDNTIVTLNNCTFDGEPSNLKAYTNNTRALSTPVASGGCFIQNAKRFELNNCRFRNLANPVVHNGSNWGPGSSLYWNGGVIENCGDNPIVWTPTKPSNLHVANVQSYDADPLIRYTPGGDADARCRFVNCVTQHPKADILWAGDRKNLEAASTRVGSV